MPKRVARPEDAATPRRRAGDTRPASPSPDDGDRLAFPEGGEAIAALIAERDRLRDELATAQARIAALERLADEDTLTPAHNRRAFMRELGRMIAFTHRYGLPSSVAYFDVNNMKHINDTYGHLAGDAALRHVAQVLAENIRSADVVGRLGGDEFGVILTQTDKEQASSKAAALAEAISKAALRWNDAEIPISAAYGVYSFLGEDDPQEAIARADEAMYREKRRSRGD